MFITIFTTGVGHPSALELALTLGEEFHSRGKSVAYLDGSYVACASLEGQGNIDVVSESPETHLPIFTKKLLVDMLRAKFITHISRSPIFQIAPTVRGDLDEQLSKLAFSPKEAVAHLIENITFLQKQFDVVIAADTFRVSEENGELAGVSDYVVVHAENEMAAECLLRHFTIPTMRRRVILLKGTRISSGYRKKGLAGAFEYWVNKGSPLMEFLMKEATRCTHPGSRRRAKRHNNAVISYLDRQNGMKT